MCQGVVAHVPVTLTLLIKRLDLKSLVTYWERVEKRTAVTYISKIQQDATVCRYLFTAKSLYALLRYYDLYQRMHLQFYVLLMTGAMDTRNV